MTCEDLGVSCQIPRSQTSPRDPLGVTPALTPRSPVRWDTEWVKSAQRNADGPARVVLMPPSRGHIPDAPARTAPTAPVGSCRRSHASDHWGTARQRAVPGRDISPWSPRCMRAWVRRRPGTPAHGHVGTWVHQRRGRPGTRASAHGCDSARVHPGTGGSAHGCDSAPRHHYFGAPDPVQAQECVSAGVRERRSVSAGGSGDAGSGYAVGSARTSRNHFTHAAAVKSNVATTMNEYAIWNAGTAPSRRKPRHSTP